MRSIRRAVRRSGEDRGEFGARCIRFTEMTHKSNVILREYGGFLVNPFASLNTA